MLPEILNEIKSYLEELKKTKKPMLKSQTQLLHELAFLDTNGLVQQGLKKYVPGDLLAESFAVASTNCPTCGKKY
jgi:hypothetical protein